MQSNVLVYRWVMVVVCLVASLGWIIAQDPEAGQPDISVEIDDATNNSTDDGEIRARIGNHVALGETGDPDFFEFQWSYLGNVFEEGAIRRGQTYVLSNLLPGKYYVTVTSSNCGEASCFIDSPGCQTKGFFTVETCEADCFRVDFEWVATEDPCTFAFRDLSDVEPTNYNYLWVFGDGASSRDVEPEPHTYSEDGAKTVNLILEHKSTGETKSSSRELLVTGCSGGGDEQPISCNISGPAFSQEGRQITLEALPTGVGPFSYHWNRDENVNFVRTSGDGGRVTYEVREGISTSTLNFSVIITSDETGQETTCSHTIKIDGNAPQVRLDVYVNDIFDENRNPNPPYTYLVGTPYSGLGTFAPFLNVGDFNYEFNYTTLAGDPNPESGHTYYSRFDDQQAADQHNSDYDYDKFQLSMDKRYEICVDLYERDNLGRSGTILAKDCKIIKIGNPPDLVSAPKIKLYFGDVDSGVFTPDRQTTHVDLTNGENQEIWYEINGDPPSPLGGDCGNDNQFDIEWIFTDISADPETSNPVVGRKYNNCGNQFNFIQSGDFECFAGTVRISAIFTKTEISEGQTSTNFCCDRTESTYIVDNYLTADIEYVPTRLTDITKDDNGCNTILRAHVDDNSSCPLNSYAWKVHPLGKPDNIIYATNTPSLSERQITINENHTLFDQYPAGSEVILVCNVQIEDRGEPAAAHNFVKNIPIKIPTKVILADELTACGGVQNYTMEEVTGSATGTVNLTNTANGAVSLDNNILSIDFDALEGTERTFTLKTKDCDLSYPVKIKQQDITINYNDNDLIIGCKGGDGLNQLAPISIQGGSEHYAYQWSHNLTGDPNTYLDHTDHLEPTIDFRLLPSDISEVEFTLMVEDDYGCREELIIPVLAIEVDSDLDVELTRDLTICHEGRGVLLGESEVACNGDFPDPDDSEESEFGSGNNEKNGCGFEFIWTSDNPAFTEVTTRKPNLLLPEHLNNQPGTYFYKVKAVQLDNGCYVEDVAEVEVRGPWVYNGFQSEIIACTEEELGNGVRLWRGNDNIVKKNPNVNSGVIFDLDYRWLPSDHNNSIEVSEFKNGIPKNGTFVPDTENNRVILQVTDAIGCVKEFQSNRAIIQESATDVDITMTVDGEMNDEVFICEGDELCFDIQINTNVTANSAYLLERSVVIEVSTNRYEVNEEGGEDTHRGTLFTPERMTLSLIDYEKGIYSGQYCFELDGVFDHNINGYNSYYTFEVREFNHNVVLNEDPLKDLYRFYGEHAFRVSIDPQTSSDTWSGCEVLYSLGNGTASRKVVDYNKILLNCRDRANVNDYSLETIARERVQISVLNAGFEGNNEHHFFYAGIDPGCEEGDLTSSDSTQNLTGIDPVDLANEPVQTDDNSSKENTERLILSPIDLQIQPNPFTGDFTLNWSIKQTEPVPVTARLLGVSGNYIATIFATQEQQAGNYSTSFTGGGLPAGLYFVELQVRGERRLEKVVKIGL